MLMTMNKYYIMYIIYKILPYVGLLLPNFFM